MTNYDKRECDYCGKEYMPARISQRFCCTACYRKFNYEKRKKNKKPQDEKICEICGKKFVAYKANQKTCSNECREVLHKRTQQKHKNKKNKSKKHNFVTIDEVIRFQIKHQKETGEYLDYTECCKRMGAY